VAAFRSLIARARDTYLSIDRRVLGAFRILYGLVLMVELGRRSLALRLCYSNDGILSNHFLLFTPQAHPQFSLFTMFSTPGEVRVAFALTGLVFALYALGLFTRVMQVLVLVLVTSLNARNLFFEDGGVSVLILLAVWTLFMPLGDRFSLDALRAEAKMPRIADRVRARAAREAPFISLSVLAILLQIAVIYWLNAVHKSGPTWKNGDAVHYVLWQNRVATELAAYIAHHEPAWFSPLSSRGTIIVEMVLPLLVLSPWAHRTLRSIAFLLAVGLHGGIALLMTLGPFSYAMIALVLLAVPPEPLVRAARLLPARRRAALVRLRARSVRTLTRLRAGPPREALIPADAGARTWLGVWRGRARELAVVFVIAASTIQVLRDNRAVPRRFKLEQPAPFQAFIGYTRMLQGWSMFAPEAPRDDGTLIVDALTANRQHIDPFTGKAPDFALTTRGPVPHQVIVSDYLFAMRHENNRVHHSELQSYLRRWQSLEGRPRGDRIISYEVWWISHDSPPRGSTTPTNLKKELILKGR
jgi:hypothetical protein